MGMKPSQDPAEDFVLGDSLQFRYRHQYPIGRVVSTYYGLVSLDVSSTGFDMLLVVDLPTAPPGYAPAIGDWLQLEYAAERNPAYGRPCSGGPS
jgi:hypothetical protein